MTKKADKARAIAALRDRNGRIDPERLIEAARDPKHPCHNDFQWDIKKAAHDAWLATAKALIREVRVEIQRGELRIIVPAYVHDPRTISEHIDTMRVAKSGSTAKRVIEDELTRIESAINRAMALSKAFQLQAMFETMLSEVEVIRRLISGESDSDDTSDGVPLS